VAGNFISKNFQIGSGVHPASYSMGTGAVFWGVKRPGREVNHSPPSSADVKSGAIPVPFSHP
jgi:hypothetical protein